MGEKVIIDGENGTLGRIASLAAKKALQGNEVAVLNSEKALISGSRASIIEKYLVRRRRKNVKFPSQADRIVKRAIRGMINYKSGRGEIAFSKVKCYKGVPKEYENSEKIKFESKAKERVSVGELARMLK